MANYQIGIFGILPQHRYVKNICCSLKAGSIRQNHVQFEVREKHLLRLRKLLADFFYVQ